jgi:hypothetical protein
MSKLLKVILFPLAGQYPNDHFPPQEDVLSQCISIGKKRGKTISFIIIETDVEYKDDGVSSVPGTVFSWLLTAGLNSNVADINSDDTDIMFVAYSTEAKNVYEIMEELETQKYAGRYYFSDHEEEVVDLMELVDIWSSSGPDSSVAKVRSPRLVRPIKQLNQFKEKYRAYSGDKLDGLMSDIEKIAIYERMIILCDYIRHYIHFGFNKPPGPRCSRRLLVVDDVVQVGDAQYSEEQIQAMVENSYLFQAEDPILKGFLLTYPVCYTREQKAPSDVQTLFFEHGQFRRELLLALIKVVAAFAKNNGLLEAKDFSPHEKGIAPPVDKKKASPRQTRTAAGVVVMNKSRRAEVRVEIPLSVPGVNPHYYTNKIWDTVERRIGRKISKLLGSPK